MLGLLIGLLFLGVYAFFLSPPTGFPTGEIIVIPEGFTLDESAKLLMADRVISSPVLFSILINLFSHEKIIAGGYVFEGPKSVFSVAFRTAFGDYGIDRVRITFPEGLSVAEMANVCASTFPACSESEFKKLGKNFEGYLFPDTYFFVPGAGAGEIVLMLRQTFDRKIASFEMPIQTFGKPLKDVLTMASILEGEARDSKDRRMVAGILWKRISIGMPLQVDIAFQYVNDGLRTKTSAELTAEDLKINSPYNTYIHKGLPPTPVGNPGLSAIEDAITPTKTSYLYYLTDKNGVFHYAKTFEEHVANKVKYLK